MRTIATKIAVITGPDPASTLTVEVRVTVSAPGFSHRSRYVSSVDIESEEEFDFPSDE